MNKIRVIGPHDKHVKAGEKRIIMNVTSSSKTWSQVFSPFFLGPIELYNGAVAQNMENAWQYAKVYPFFADAEGNPKKSYFLWAMKGWNNPRAVRYPMGKGAKPLYSWWRGKKLGYIQARKEIYVPLYTKAVLDSGYFEALVNFVDDCWRDGVEVCFWDYDGYDYLSKDMDPKEVINSPKYKLGHGFILAWMVEKVLNSPEWREHGEIVL